MPISSTKIRRHTIVAGSRFENHYVASLEKDWFSYEWVTGWRTRHVIERPQGQFHVVSNELGFSRVSANALVDAAITGKTKLIDLRGFATTALDPKNGGK